MGLLGKLLGEMETSRLVLRRWREGDYEDFLSFAADPAVMLSSGAKPVRTQEEGETAFRRALWDSGCYAIVLKETGKAIGKIKFQKDLRRYQVNSLSIGYELAREYWGNGYMPEALRAMIVCAFQRKNVEVLAISHFAGNDRSRRVIEKCGFRYEGTIVQAFCRCDGRVMDDVCYSILREEYEADPQRYGGTT